MKKKEILKKIRKFTKPFRVIDGSEFKLKRIYPGDTLSLKSEDKPKAQEALKNGVELLAELQNKLYAQDRCSVLLIFQAMDAAGKDSVIKHVMSGTSRWTCCGGTSRSTPWPCSSTRTSSGRSWTSSAGCATCMTA